LHFSRQIFKNDKASYLTKIHSEAADFFQTYGRTDRQTGMKKLIVAFRTTRLEIIQIWLLSPILPTLITTVFPATWVSSVWGSGRLWPLYIFAAPDQEFKPLHLDRKDRSH